MSSRLHVAVAVIRNPTGQYLISQRHKHAHLGGFWEFPGGKVEAGESILSALKREIDEELGLKVETAEPLIQLAYDYPDQQVLLDTWLVSQFSGQAQGLEGQNIAWVDPENLGSYAFPAANRPIIRAASLPRMYPIVDDSLLQSETAVMDHLVRLLNAGHRLIQLRLQKFSNAHRINVVARCVELCHTFGACLVLNQDIQSAIDLGAGGVHLNRHRLMKLESINVPDRFLVGASCHDQQELQKATGLGVDFAVLSPVGQTLSHPESSPLGWDAFKNLLLDAQMPVFALGGMQLTDYDKAIRLGAQGLAGVRLFL